MTVKELIVQLKKENPDRLVVMSSDSEGNNYSPLSDFYTGAYRAESTWNGEIGLEKLTAEDKKGGWSKDDIITDGVPALVLCPTN